MTDLWNRVELNSGSYAGIGGLEDDNHPMRCEGVRNESSSRTIPVFADGCPGCEIEGCGAEDAEGACRVSVCSKPGIGKLLTIHSHQCPGDRTSSRVTDLPVKIEDAL